MTSPLKATLRIFGYAAMAAVGDTILRRAAVSYHFLDVVAFVFVFQCGKFYGKRTAQGEDNNATFGSGNQL